MWRYLFLLIGLFAAGHSDAAEYRAMGPDIFDPKIPGEKLIDVALARAKVEEKRVLILFGANWCPWCRQLHRTLAGEPAVQTVLRDKYILVYVDANTRNDKFRNAEVLKRYGNPTAEYGLPVFVVLDRTGKQIATRETASLAASTDAEVGERLRAFLSGEVK